MAIDTQQRDSAYARSVVPRDDAGWDRATLMSYTHAFAAAFGDLPTKAWMHPATRATLGMAPHVTWSDVFGDETPGACTIMDDPDYREDILILYR